MAGRKVVHRCHVLFLTGSAAVLPLAGAGSGGGWGREARAVTARNACASMDRVMCRYQAR